MKHTLKLSHPRQERRELAQQWARVRQLRGRCRAWGWYDVACMLATQLSRLEYQHRMIRTFNPKRA